VCRPVRATVSRSPDWAGVEMLKCTRSPGLQSRVFPGNSAAAFVVSDSAGALSHANCSNKMAMKKRRIKRRDEKLYLLFRYYKQMVDFLDAFVDSFSSERPSIEIALPYNELYTRLCNRIDELSTGLDLGYEMHVRKCRPYENLLGLGLEKMLFWTFDERPRCGDCLAHIQALFVNAGGKELPLDESDETFLGEVRKSIESMKGCKAGQVRQRPRRRRKKPGLEKQQEKGKNGTDVQLAGKFPTPSGAGWGDVSIKFTDGHTVSIKVKNETRMFHYTQMGMANKNNTKPTVLWVLLAAFANHHGTLAWGDSEADRKNQKRKERLSKKLRAFFGIEDDPFRLLEKNAGWQTRFELSPH
jgi:hypothetical protein